MRYLVALLFALPVSLSAHAQSFELPASALVDDAALAVSMPALAERISVVYKENDRDKLLDNQFRLQIVAGHYADAANTIAALRELRLGNHQDADANRNFRFAIYARAKLAQREQKLAFDAAFQQAFRDELAALDGLTAADVIRSFGAHDNSYGPSLGAMQGDFDAARAALKGKHDIDLVTALDLIRKYQALLAFRGSWPLTDVLVTEDDQRRYVVREDILVDTPDGAKINVILLRPRSDARATTLLEFTIYATRASSVGEARLTAAHGYAAAVAYARGKGLSPDQPVAYEHDGADADAVIEWISKQDWSDGRVGMYGGSYNGFTQWAAAKHKPPALKAMMTSVAAAPAIDVPMEGGVFLNFLYPWPLYTTTNKTVDQERYDDHARWDRLNRSWYTDGKAYRQLDLIDGTPNPVFRRWLDHPTYDAYWQKMIPYREEFAQIDIPVLATDGYLSGQGLSSAYYFSEHQKYNPRAEHYYIIGPYDHFGAQQTPANVIQGYAIDPVARIDIGRVLRYQWFDYVFRGAPKPALLKDKVNYEVMGANVWKHAPTLDAMSGASRRFHLTAARNGDKYVLAASPDHAFVSHRIDFKDRSDIDHPVPPQLVDKLLDMNNAVAYVSAPIAPSIEVSGRFSAQLDFIANKKDLDFTLSLYEQLPDGRYFPLSYYVARASLVRDRSHRQLLVPGKRERLAFKAGRLTSRRFEPGSRLVVVLAVNKQQDLQINYGTGGDVSDETIADAKEPLQIQWFGDSHVDVPVSK